MFSNFCLSFHRARHNGVLSADVLKCGAMRVGCLIAYSLYAANTVRYSTRRTAFTATAAPPHCYVLHIFPSVDSCYNIFMLLKRIFLSILLVLFFFCFCCLYWHYCCFYRWLLRALLLLLLLLLLLFLPLFVNFVLWLICSLFRRNVVMSVLCVVYFMLPRTCVVGACHCRVNAAVAFISQFSFKFSDFFRTASRVRCMPLSSLRGVVGRFTQRSPTERCSCHPNASSDGQSL